MDEEAGFFVTVAVVFTALFGTIWATELEQDKRVDILNGIAAEACKNVTSYSEEYCLVQTREDIQRAEDRDVMDLRKHGRDNFETLKVRIPFIVSDWDQTYGRVKQDLRNVVIDGNKPFQNAYVQPNIQSVVRYGGRVTGKFSVSITDSGSKAERTFQYDHATGNVTQAVGDKLTATFNIPGSAFSQGGLNMQQTAPEICRAGRETACAVVGAVVHSMTAMPQYNRNVLQEETGEGRYSRLRVMIDKMPGARPI